MSALTQDRNTPYRSGAIRTPGVAAGVKIYAGALVMATATGFARPGGVATTLKPLGRAEEQVDNSAGADGDVIVPVSVGIFRFGNSAAADAITAADIGSNCYAVDDQTVAKTNGSATRSVAGVIWDVDDLGVWVKIG
ncbi:hypothetical protein [Ancylobacter pratisalsi]|uniref:DUF2190 family protein n=1 Tax=Ancylobacter pratisalsi TaxID=1745854 RepID=A0A6P1YSV0_9HYPH|nr:hypothetical protein [Ancylobacter pratisalsi]QIB34754.1 hypothetical protein G3A50_14340 [Ancylobacter pratisalsi]